MFKRIKWLSGSALFLSFLLHYVPAMAAPTWQQTTVPAGGGGVYALAIAPTSPPTLYCGSNGGGVFKSTNGGTSWSSCNNAGLTYTLALAIDPANPQIVYAGTQQSGILKSTDGGGSWNAVNSGLPSGLNTLYVYSLAIDPTNSQTIYAGTKQQGVYKSIDGGATWFPVNTGLNFNGFYVMSLAIDPNNPLVVYAGTNTGAGLFRSTNGGGSWSGVNIGLSSTDVWNVVIDPSNSQTIYAVTTGGVYKSTSGGSSWSAMNNGLTNGNVRCLVIDPTNNQTVYVSTYYGGGGVFQSTNGGGLWSAVNNGLTYKNVYPLAIDPSSQIIYAGTDGSGVFKGISDETIVTPGTNVTVTPTPGVTVTIPTVITGGTITVTTNPTPADPPANFRVITGSEYLITSTASLNGSLVVCLSYDDAALADHNNEGSIKLFHHNGQNWEDITTSNDTLNNIVCGTTFTLSPFSLMEASASGATAPTVVAPPNATATEGILTPFSMGSFSDLDGSPWNVTINWGDGTALTAFTANSTGSLGTQSHAYGDNGTYTATLTVTDSTSLFSVKTFLITVYNAAPVVNAGANQIATVGSVVSLAPSATFTDTGTQDSHGATIAWGDGTTRTGMVTETGGSGTVAGYHIYAQAGNYTVTVRVTDDDGAFSADTLTMTVTFPPAPTISGTPSTTATVGTAYNFPPTSTNAASFSYTGTLPPGLSLNNSTGVLSGTPTTTGTYSNIVITATNVTGSATLPSFSITVAQSGGGGSGTPVPVMNGWWLVPGVLAGVGMFARRRRE